MKKNVLVFILGLLFSFVSISCSLQESGVDLATEVDTDECKESGSTSCVQDAQSSELEMVIRSDNPVQSRSAEGDCSSNSVTPPSLVATALSDTGAPQVMPLPDSNTTFVANRTYCFDISGTCNEGANDSAHIVLKNPPSFITSPPVISTCKRGVFHAQLKAVFTSEAEVILRHTIELELIGKKINNEEETNPSKARKFIDIMVQSRIDNP